MKRVLLGLTILGTLAAAGAARADDLRYWNGFYVGINGGYSWGSETTEYTLSGVGGEKSGLRSDGFIAGGQAGYNYQAGPWVLGLEGDFQYRDASRNSTQFLSSTDSLAFHDRQSWFGTLRPRLGVSPGNWPLLLYLTGGLAVGELGHSYTEQRVTVPGAIQSRADTAIEIGWAAGGGAEWKMGQWSLGLEYLHLDFGSKTLALPAATAGGVNFAASSAKFSDQSETVRLKINYHFWTPRQPMAEEPPPSMQPVPMPAAAPVPAPAPAPRLFIVFFDFDRYNLTPEGRKIVEEAAATYKAGGSAKVTLAGYTDLSGPAGYNMKLSERRAKAVAAAMVKLGVPESAMDVSWHGKENPRVPTPDGVREPQNRRVEITE